MESSLTPAPPPQQISPPLSPSAPQPSSSAPTLQPLLHSSDSTWSSLSSPQYTSPSHSPSSTAVPSPSSTSSPPTSMKSWSNTGQISALTQMSGSRTEDTRLEVAVLDSTRMDTRLDDTPSAEIPNGLLLSRLSPDRLLQNCWSSH